MNSNVIYIISNVQKPQLEPEKLEKENENMYIIVGIIDGHYIVQTPKGLIKVKVGSLKNQVEKESKD
jgi:hypothetical protein